MVTQSSIAPQPLAEGVSPSKALPPAVLLVTGKGGVGKSTVAAGLAHAFARDGARTALVQFNHGHQRTPALHPKVEVVSLERESALEAVAQELLGSRLLARLLLQNFAMRRLIGAAPAVHELAILHAVQQLRRAGFERAVVDMPATGHGLAWLRVPAQLAALLRSGPLHALAERVAKGLADPAETGLVVVTLAEPLVLSETLELLAELRRFDATPAVLAVLNRVPRSLLAAEKLAEATSEAMHPALATALQLRRERLQQVQRFLGPLRDAGLAVTSIPHSAEALTAQFVAQRAFPSQEAA